MNATVSRMRRTLTGMTTFVLGVPVWAQSPGSWWSDLSPWTWGIVAAVILIAIIVYFMISRQNQSWDQLVSEPEPERSKYEQLLAEIQGIYLRVQNGESKGYYHKIEQLVRIFVERLGFEDARKMPDDKLKALFNSGNMPSNLGPSLDSIYERCKQGIGHETEKLEFSAAQLLTDLRGLVRKAESASPPPHQG